MRIPNKDEIIEILIVKYTDALDFFEAVKLVYGRIPTYEEIKLIDAKINEMRQGFVSMNIKTRNKKFR